MFELNSANSVNLPNDTTIPAGWTIRIAFQQQSDGTITDVNCLVTDGGATVGSMNIALLGQQLAAGGPITEKDLAQLIAFQVVLVGWANSASAVLGSGAGTITCTSNIPMTPNVPWPPNSGGGGGTAEQSNSAYSLVPAQSSTSIVQRFSVHGFVSAKGSPLTCLQAGAGGTRVYYHGQDNNVREMAFSGGGPSAVSGPLPPAKAGKNFSAKAGSPLTCLYINDVGARVYFLNDANTIVELASDQSGNWTPNDTGVAAAHDSRLTCLLAGSGGTRVYYQDQNNNVRELALIGGGPAPSSLAQPAKAGSPLTCLYINDVGARVYFLNDANTIVELASDQSGNWTPNDTGVAAAHDSRLTCLLAGSGGTRVYYQDQNNNVRELALIGGGPAPSSLAQPAKAGSPLTCLYINDVGARVYFLNDANTIVELASDQLTNPLILNDSKMPEFWSPAPDDVANRAGQKRACASRSIGWNWFMIF